MPNAGKVGLFFSTLSGTVASDGSNNSHSPFTAALLAHLDKPNLTWPELVGDVSETVRQSTKGQQVWTEGGAELARFKLFPVAEFSKKTQEKIMLSEADTQLLTQGLWRDPITNLIWMRCSFGQTWVNNNCDGNAQRASWNTAIDMGKTLNFNGVTNWRLPTVDELKSLVVLNQEGYNASFLMKPTLRYGDYWTSSRLQGFLN
ncbi:MAG: DUF1566 domain-containing protein [Moraxellaceae bacterium]|nr:DUF1566 domain-containing protein [Moraxellaceae bacterium]